MEKLPIIFCIIMILMHLCTGFTPNSGEEIEYTALAGRNTTLPCIFQGIPCYVTWLKGDSPPLNVIARYGGNTNSGTTDNGKYRVQKDFSPGNSSFSLTIADVEIADAGRYRCAVTDINGTFNSKLLKKNYNIKVLVPPKLLYPRIIPMIPDSDGGQPINLTCRTDGGSIGLAKLYWMNNDTRHIQQEMVSYPNADGTTENVTSVIEAYPSDKPYNCVATLNISGHESATASISIPPLHGSTPTYTPASTQTVTTKSTDRRNQTMDDTGSVISRPDAWGMAIGALMIPVGIAVFGNTSSPSQSIQDGKENEAGNETLMTTV